MKLGLIASVAAAVAFGGRFVDEVNVGGSDYRLTCDIAFFVVVFAGRLPDGVLDRDRRQQAKQGEADPETLRGRHLSQRASDPPPRSFASNTFETAIVIPGSCCSRFLYLVRFVDHPCTDPGGQGTQGILANSFITHAVGVLVKRYLPLKIGDAFG